LTDLSKRVILEQYLIYTDCRKKISAWLWRSSAAFSVKPYD